MRPLQFIDLHYYYKPKRNIQLLKEATINTHFFLTHNDYKKIIASYQVLDIMNQKSNNNGVYSLEPGGQLEWSSPPFSNLNDMSFSMEMHKDALCKVVNEQELKILNFSVDPIFSPVEVDLINQLKYQLN